MRVSGSLENRLLSRRNIVQRDYVTPCWEWIGSTDNHGYGQLNFEGKRQKAHRLAYRTWVGKLIQGMQVDHLCFNRICFCPFHLDQIGNRENTLRSRQRKLAATHCIKGHAFTDDNIRWESITRSGYTSHYRRCLTCQRTRDVVYKALRRAA